MKKTLTTTVFGIILVLNSWSQELPGFIEHSIDENFRGVSAICVSDIDRDGFKDLVCGSEATSATSGSIGLWWLKNDGNNNWSRHEIDAGFNNVMSVEIADINNDGYADVLASAWTSHQIAYWLNDGDSLPNWTKVIVKQSFVNAHDAHALDMNKDSLIDIVGLSAYLGKVAVWYQQSDGSFLEQIIDNAFTGARALAIADYNGDGNLDVSAVSATKGQLVVYYSNNENPVVWTKSTVSSSISGAHEIINLDADNDGDIDLLSSAYTCNQIDLWINQGGNEIVWTNQPVGIHIGVNRSIPADFDMDGNIDVVATGKYPSSKLSVWNNRGDSLNTFAESVINSQLSAFWALAVDDFDNDGDQDFIAGASVSAVIRWWENLYHTSTIKTEEHESGMNIFPNPCTKEATIHFSAQMAKNLKLRILNSNMGWVNIPEKSITEEGNNQIVINTGILAEGIYFCQLISGEKSITKKMVVLK